MLFALLLAALTFESPEPPPPVTRAQATAPAPRPPQKPAPRARPEVPAPPAPPAPAQHPAPPSVLQGEWPAPSGKRVTLEDTTALDDALEEIADAAGWNVVLNTGRTGNKLLVLKLRNVPVEDALKAALAGTELVATRSGDMVVVAPRLERPRAAAGALTGFEKPTGKRFTGDFDHTPVADALRTLCKSAGLSVVIPDEAAGTVSGHFVDIPVEEALQAVLVQAGLAAERTGSLITVRVDRFAQADRFDLRLPPGFAEDARRSAEEALRQAERELRRAGREVDESGGRDRQSTGQDVVVRSGEAVRDVSVVRGNVQVQGGAAARDVSAVFGSVQLDRGAAARDVSSVFGGAKLAGGAVTRNVVAVGGDVEIGPGAAVEQDVTSIGGRVIVDPSATVGGDTKSIPFPSLPGVVGHTASSVFREASPILTVLEALISFAVLFVLGLLVLALFPRRLEAVASYMVASPGKSLLAGTLGTVAMPVLLVLLAVTVVGILLIPVQILGMIAAGVLGVTALTFHVGRALPVPEKRRTVVLQLALGTAIFVVLAHIPFVGALVWIATWLVTFGAVLRSRFGQQSPPVLPTTPAPPAAL
ncbi:secretin and TonB N-terminal domain-containing protein [Anaeromyxobacter sp. PSR-1]|uniref:secretin and TonB N-terminal domain-containing protein n=1 Tax=unclassified Anaeromyxobacter TaxID=2620896 RepID=UPI0005DAFF6A|nr:STN domain-containing protein [Anaeromyxobacter sp. PSR-1]GAO04778.1 outer membrane porin HofQ [Anaeromyxobacter sp. PSR-1]